MANVLLLQSAPPKLEDAYKTIFSKGALDFLAKIHRQFDKKIEQLYKNRQGRSFDIQNLSELDFVKSEERSDSSWTVAPLPSRLQRTDIPHRYMVDIPFCRTKRFASTFIIRTAKEWNSLPESVFPVKYNPGVYKSRVNRYLLGKRATSSITSSLNIRNRHLDLGDVSASNTAHFVSTLNEDVQGIQVDFDDGHCPTWRNQLVAYHNITQAVRGKLPGAPLNISMCPVLMLRPRAWNMMEHNILIDGIEAVGPVVDFAILMYHNAIKLYEANSGPYFYLSKLEGASEAALWNEIFVWTQTELGLPQGTIKACVLIENIVSTFELEEILYALKDHSLGLNCGIWDYCASIIAKFGDRKQFLLPDRNKYVNMEQRFLNSYLRLVVATCHKRGAPATGGMAAAMIKPGSDGSDKESKVILNKILEAKLKEIECGVDGFMVYDSRVVPFVNELWKKTSPTPNQIDRKFDLNITSVDLLSIPSGGVTLQGIKHNVAISILFIYYWLAGIGHFFYSGNVEDSATAEISRWQIWQWIRFSPELEDNPEKRVTAKLIEKTASNFAAHAHKNLCRSNAERKRLTAARYMSMELFLCRNPPEFITSYLNDNHKFRTLHNKSLMSNL